MGDQPLGTSLKNPFTWLHLADVRFGAKDSLAAESMWDALEGDVFAALPKDGLQPQAVFLTGSITATGTEPDFVMAEKRFARWVRFLGLDPKTRWFVSPGPGDVDREALTDFERRFRNSFQSREEENKLLAESKTWERFAERQAAFLDFTERFLGRRRAWAPEQPWAVDRLELETGENVGRQGSCRLKVCVSCWGTPIPAGHFFSPKTLPSFERLLGRKSAVVVTRPLSPSSASG